MLTEGIMEEWKDRQTDGTNENYIPLQHTLYAGGIIIEPQSQKTCLRKCAQQRFKSACASTQYYQNLHWVYFDSQEYQVPSCGHRPDSVYVQADLSLHWVSVRRYVFSHCIPFILVLHILRYFDQYYWNFSLNLLGHHELPHKLHISI